VWGEEKGEGERKYGSSQEDPKCVEREDPEDVEMR
jgi:hypothetical protein